MRIHLEDADSGSKRSFYDAVAINDRFDFWMDLECFFRFKVTGLPPGSDTIRRFTIEFIATTTVNSCVGVDEPESLIAVEFRWNPAPGFLGADGIRILLGDEPTPGGGTYRLAQYSSVIIDVPSGMTVMLYGGLVFSDGGMNATLEDVASGSVLLLDAGSGKELYRRVVTSEEEAGAPARDVNALFDQILESARLVP